MILHSPLQPHLRPFLESPLSFILSSCGSTRHGTLLSSSLALYVSFETQHLQDLCLVLPPIPDWLLLDTLSNFPCNSPGYRLRSPRCQCQRDPQLVPESFHYPDPSHPFVARAIRSIHLYDLEASHSSLGRRRSFYCQNEMDDKDICHWRCALFCRPVHR